MRITRTGIGVASAAVLLFVGARAFGLLELFVMAVALVLVVVLSAAWVRFRSVDVAVSRQVVPRRVHAGDTALVNVAIHNRMRTSPVLAVHDPVTGTRGVDLLVAPQHPRATVRVSYRLPTQHRGIVEAGPMTVTVTDPFGIWRTTWRVLGVDDAVVLPAVHDIAPMRRTVGPDPDSGTHRGSIGLRGDDFAALRSYVVGDDLRRVHWLASARTDDELLVRIDDVPWHGRVVVVLDLRRHVYDHDSFEAAVSAAASIVRTHVGRGDHVRLTTTAGFDSGYATGSAHAATILDRLAVVDTGPRGGLVAAVEAACHGGSGALVVVSGRPSAGDVAVVDSARAVPERRIVCFAGGASAVSEHGTMIVSADSSSAFAAEWDRAEAFALTGRWAAGR